MQKKIFISILAVVLMITFIIGFNVLFSTGRPYIKDYIAPSLLTILPGIGLLILLNNCTKK